MQVLLGPHLQKKILGTKIPWKLLCGNPQMNDTTRIKISPIMKHMPQKKEKKRRTNEQTFLQCSMTNQLPAQPASKHSSSLRRFSKPPSVPEGSDTELCVQIVPNTDRSTGGQLPRTKQSMFWEAFSYTQGTNITSGLICRH